MATVEELREKARELEIKGYSGMNKADLEKAVQKAEPSEAGRAAAARNATPEEGGVAEHTRVIDVHGSQPEGEGLRENDGEPKSAEEHSLLEEKARDDKAAARETDEVKAATTKPEEVPENVQTIRNAQGLGGTGDTGAARTIEEREQAASASSFKGGNARSTFDNEVAMRAQDDARQARVQPQVHNQEAEAYFTSALHTAFREIRGSLTGLRNAVTPTRQNTGFQPSPELLASVQSLEEAINTFGEQNSIPV